MQKLVMCLFKSEFYPLRPSCWSFHFLRNVCVPLFIKEKLTVISINGINCTSLNTLRGLSNTKLVLLNVKLNFFSLLQVVTTILLYTETIIVWHSNLCRHANFLGLDWQLNGLINYCPNCSITWTGLNKKENTCLTKKTKKRKHLEIQPIRVIFSSTMS